MADKKISAFTEATSLAGGDLMPITLAGAGAGSNRFVKAANVGKIAYGAITADSPMMDHSQEWNNSGVTFNGWKMAVTDTLSAAGSLLASVKVNTVSMLSLSKVGKLTCPNLSSPLINIGTTPLAEVTGGTHAGVRNGVNAMTWSVSGSFTDSSNHFLGRMRMLSADFVIETFGVGTGVAALGDIMIKATGVHSIHFYTNALERWGINSNGVLYTSGAYDIGTAGFAPKDILITGKINVGAAGTIGWDTLSKMSSPADGIILMQDNGLATFDRLIFGVNSALGVSLKRNGIAMELRLGDGSNVATLLHAHGVKSGTPVDGDFTNPVNGLIILDITGNKIWARCGVATWKGVAIA